MSLCTCPFWCNSSPHDYLNTYIFLFQVLDQIKDVRDRETELTKKKNKFISKKCLREITHQTRGFIASSLSPNNKKPRDLLWRSVVYISILRIVLLQELGENVQCEFSGY